MCVCGKALNCVCTHAARNGTSLILNLPKASDSQCTHTSGLCSAVVLPTVYTPVHWSSFEQATVLIMSCSCRLKPNSSTTRCAPIASDNLMSGSSIPRVGLHIFRRAMHESMGSPCCLARGAVISLFRLEGNGLLTDLLDQMVYAIRQQQSLQASVPNNTPRRPSSIFETHPDISMSASATSARVDTTGSVALAIYPAGMIR